MDSVKKAARGEEGRAFARAVILQTQADLVTKDPNPVLERLKEQARAGVGNVEGYLPHTLFIHFAERIWGKTLDRMKLVGARPFDGLSDAELASRAEAVARRLREKKEKA